MAELQKPANLEPLPLGITEQAPSAAAPTSAALEPLDPVSQWLEENPTFEEPAVTPEPQATATPEPPAVPVSTETPAATPTATTQTTAPEAKPTETPAPVANAETPAQPAPQPEVKPAADPLAADEKIKLSNDAEWTRAQIVEALRERSTQAPLAKEADGFRKLFGMPLEEAQRSWGPVMQRLATEPKTVAFLDAYLADPGKAAYLEQCAANYDEKVGAAPAAPVPAATQIPANDPLAREVAELRTWRMQQEMQAAQERFNREWSQATQKYPFLATDANLRNDLILTAKALNAQDNNKGLLDALALKAALYDAKIIASNAPASSQPAPAPAAVAQPTLVGSPGASPNGTRATATRPKSFESLDDAVDDFLNNPPQEYK